MINSTEHFSFTVSSLDASLHFFCDLLGLEATAPVLVEHEEVRKIIGVPGARLRISLVRLPDDKSIELVEYLAPKGAVIDLASYNTGVAHIAFNVSSIDKMYGDLSEKGVSFVSAPVWESGSDGQKKNGVCYLKGPDGITLEFIERV